MKRGRFSVQAIVLTIVLVVTFAGLFFLINESGRTAYSIGDVYGEKGIAPLTQLPRYVHGGPTPEFPAGPMETIGTRTPFMIFFKGEYRNIREMSVCWNDLSWKLPVPEDAFTCYSVPTSGPAEEVTGWFWPDSSAAPRPLYQLGGDVYCYEHDPYKRELMMNRLKDGLLTKGWEVSQVNGMDVLMCKKGEKFLYPQ